MKITDFLATMTSAEEQPCSSKKLNSSDRLDTQWQSLGEGLFKIEDPQDDEDGLFLYGGEQILDEAINMINVFGEHDDKLTELGLQ